MEVKVKVKVKTLMSNILITQFVEEKLKGIRSVEIETSRYIENVGS